MPQFHDLPLPLPAPELLLKVLLVVFFIAHIIFVEMMVGGSILCTYFEWRGLKDRSSFYDHVSLEIAKSITVNKSMAVVLGVGPLLLINVTYTIFFYSSSVLIGNAWILVIPMAISAFLLTYLHQYAWDFFAAHKRLHITIIALATLHFLIIPFFFLTNTHLMWFPSIWDQIQGFFSALSHPNIFARYFFFLSTTLTVTGLFLYWLFERKIREQEFTAGSSEEKQSLFLQLNHIVLLGMVGQGLFGLAVILTAPQEGLARNLLPLLANSMLFFLPPLFLVGRAAITRTILAPKQLRAAVASLLVAVFCAGTLRHAFRENALGPHQVNMKRNTESYRLKVQEAKKVYGIKDYKYE